MPKIPPESVMFPGRGVSLKGSFYTRTVNGRLYVSRWPRRQPTPRNADEADKRKLLADAARATSYMSAGAQSFARDLAAQSKLLPRDFLMIALFNRIGYIIRRDGSKVYSMPAMQDVSNLLDAIAQVKGDLMFRGDNWWTRLPIGLPNQVLTVSDDGLPQWETPAGGGGGKDAWMQPLLFNPTGGGITVGASTFIVIPVVPSQNVTLNGLKVWVTAAGSGRTIVPGLYASNGLTVVGGARLAQGSAVAATTGVKTLPFLVPANLLADTMYWIGITVIGGSGNLQTMPSDVNRSSYMYWTQSTAPLPNTAPAATAGTGGLQFTWWGY